MADARRLPLIVVFAALVVAGALFGTTNGAKAQSQAGPGQPSLVPGSALSSSWFCAGATEAPVSVAAGQLLFDNAGSTAVSGSVELVSQTGYHTDMAVSVPAGGTSTFDEDLPGLAGGASDHWVGAMVTLYGGMASVSQVVTTSRGSASQPCASAAAPQWYFPDGASLRNAWDEISLLNPYPVVAVADLVFSTEQGREQPSAFDGVVVPADGLTVLNLGSHLRRRQHIAVTVTTRTGDVVAYETELVTHPPAGAAPLGAPGAVNPVVPVAGITLTLGATHTAGSLWWPDGGEGPGVTETYAVYNPGPALARLTLSFVSGAGNGVGSSSQFTVGPYGSSIITTNGQPWALPGVAYAAHLRSADGVGVVAERFVMAGPPSLQRGLGVLLGQSQASRRWVVTGGLAVGSSFQRSESYLGQVSLEVVDPGPAPAVVTVEQVSHNGLAPVAGLTRLAVVPAQRYAWPVPASLAGQTLVVSASRPILLEQGWSSSLLSVGTNLAPGMALSSP